MKQLQVKPINMCVCVCVCVCVHGYLFSESISLMFVPIQWLVLLG